MIVSESKPMSFVVARVEFRASIAVVTGLAVGAMTSAGQTHLGGALNAFVNSASAWLVAPYVLGRIMQTRRGGALAGLAVAIAQLLGYYLTAHLRGYPAGGSIVLFWAACALVGGPLFGLGGYVSRTGDRSLAGLGATLLPASFLAEGLWVYLHELHYRSTAAIWIAIGVFLAVLLPHGFRQRRWLALTLVAGIAGEIALGTLYRQAV
jgi:hypothetical protein